MKTIQANRKVILISLFMIMLCAFLAVLFNSENAYAGGDDAKTKFGKYFEYNADAQEEFKSGTTASAEISKYGNPEVCTKDAPSWGIVPGKPYYSGVRFENSRYNCDIGNIHLAVTGNDLKVGYSTDRDIDTRRGPGEDGNDVDISYKISLCKKNDYVTKYAFEYRECDGSDNSGNLDSTNGIGRGDAMHKINNWDTTASNCSTLDGIKKLNNYPSALNGGSSTLASKIKSGEWLILIDGIKIDY